MALITPCVGLYNAKFDVSNPIDGVFNAIYGVFRVFLRGIDWVDYAKRFRKLSEPDFVTYAESTIKNGKAII
jgi:hypothetical protein